MPRSGAVAPQFGEEGVDRRRVGDIEALAAHRHVALAQLGERLPARVARRALAAGQDQRARAARASHRAVCRPSAPNPPVIR
jgi:hypothetical protein